MSVIAFETPGLKSFPAMPVPVWKTLGFYANHQIDEGVRYLTSVLTEQEPSKEAWWVGFDFCRLSGKEAAQAALTEKYAAVFNRPPPDWTSYAAQPLQVTTSKGQVLNVLTISNPESEQYATAFTAAQEKKTAILLKFTPKRQLSWQENAVQRLAKGIDALKKAKVPVYLENPEVILEHIKRIAFDRRTDADWGILFYTLLYTNHETLFEEEALQYTLAKGMSPPSFEKLGYPPQHTWFDGAPVATYTDNDTGHTIVLNGNLAQQIGGLSQRVSARLQRQESIILDLRGINQADWTSVFEIAGLHHKIWATNSRKMFISKMTPLMTKMLELAGVPESSFTAIK